MEGRRHHDDRTWSDAREIALGDERGVGDGVSRLVLDEDAGAGNTIRRQALGQEVRLGVPRRRAVAVTSGNDEGDVAFARERRRSVGAGERRLGRAAVLLETRSEDDRYLRILRELSRAPGHTPKSPTMTGRPTFAEP